MVAISLVDVEIRSILICNVSRRIHMMILQSNLSIVDMLYNGHPVIAEFF